MTDKFEVVTDEFPDFTLTFRGWDVNIGTQDLVRFADHGLKNGFSVKRFSVVDANLEPLDSALGDKFSAEMIQMLHEYGMVELDAAFREEFDSLYLNGVTLTSHSTAASFSINRRGEVAAELTEEALAFLNDACLRLLT